MTATRTVTSRHVHPYRACRAVDRPCHRRRASARPTSSAGSAPASRSVRRGEAGRPPSSPHLGGHLSPAAGGRRHHARRVRRADGRGGHDVLAGSGGDPASAAASQPAHAPVTVVAQPGDTLWSIASAHHGEASITRYLDTLVDLNGGADDRGRPDDRAPVATDDARQRSSGGAAARTILTGCIAPAVRPTTPRWSTRAWPKRARGSTPPPVPVVLVPLHHLRAPRRGAADGGQVRRLHAALRSRQDRLRGAGGIEGSLGQPSSRSNSWRPRSKTRCGWRVARSPRPGSGWPCSTGCGSSTRSPTCGSLRSTRTSTTRSDFQSELELLSKLGAAAARRVRSRRPHPAAEGERLVVDQQVGEREAGIEVGCVGGDAGAVAADHPRRDGQVELVDQVVGEQAGVERRPALGLHVAHARHDPSERRHRLAQVDSFASGTQHVAA